MSQPSLQVYADCRTMQLATLRNLGHAVPVGATILDFGCGQGDLVGLYRRDGFEAFGCDIAFSPEAERGDLFVNGVLRKIESNPYRVPFENDTFDLVLSNGVFEHVQDYDTAFREIRRVMKPGGVSLHVFPSRYSPIERHTHIPLGTTIQSYGWLLFWAAMGLRGPTRKGLSARQAARSNHRFLKDSTHYLSRAEILRSVRPHFSVVRFCEREFMMHSPRGRQIARMSRILPFIPFLYGAARNRALFLVK
ncbi:class I SAM-dependent methyltransferase [Candidatus Sumerlaeota bacterium]|nr:class I SAM-dependent methyltransferase [Candidatus Sumerlaeota bacterium]